MWGSLPFRGNLLSYQPKKGNLILQRVARWLAGGWTGGRVAGWLDGWELWLYSWPQLRLSLAESGYCFARHPVLILTNSFWYPEQRVKRVRTTIGSSGNFHLASILPMPFELLETKVQNCIWSPLVWPDRTITKFKLLESYLAPFGLLARSINFQIAFGLVWY